MKVPSFYEGHQMFHFTLYSMNNDDEMRYLWTIRPDISKDGIHILVEFEPIQSQTFSDVQHTHWINGKVVNSSVTLCMIIHHLESLSRYGLKEQIDDLIESDTIRLLDWNDAMTDL
ncbi:hypothetical protein M9H77_18164 [Catharanthus roseus]|uniref:Uncharacterized protein n=1 Tax=Catharanthus roseus TaxID=4058 RepID=A0ACC0B6N4_CATRO|nr:hypothetical protein M9H77_18164 [Catharanthus roseus]